MDVMDAINLLKKYNMYDAAQAECKRKKISDAPYNMQGHHDVYCSYLSKKWIEFRDTKTKLQNEKCKEWANISGALKPVHDDCFFVETSLRKKYCETNCKYYINEIEPLYNAMEELSEAQNVLKDAAQRDYYLK